VWEERNYLSVEGSEMQIRPEESERKCKKNVVSYLQWLIAGPESTMRVAKDVAPIEMSICEKTHTNKLPTSTGT
jgi:hypothetical protein